MNESAAHRALTNQPILNQGSIWRKWDLHLHAPSSVFNNQFKAGPKSSPWENYLSTLEGFKDVAVLGITDYFSIEGYKRIVAEREANRLTNISLVLPNVELRLKLLIPTKVEKDEAKTKKVNAHVIVSDEVSIEDIEQHFLLQLKFSALGYPQATNEQWTLSQYQLEKFGERLKAEHANFDGMSDYEVGCMNASVDFDQLKQVLFDHRSVFEGRYLIFIASENLSLISWDSQGHQLRKTLVQGSSGVFGNSSDREFLLGKKHPTPADFVEEFGALKPCIQGSDAHSVETIGAAVDGKYCWIKADPTFEGLRQIVFEPEERVFLGDAPPDLKHAFRVISSVAITDAPDWFSYSPIPLNSALVSVIGGKGAGKSALAELISYVGGSEAFRGKKNKELADTFLAKASNRTATNLRPITRAKVTLTWADNETDQVSVNEQLDHGMEEEKVKYLPQKFVERVCSPENHSELLREMERVIFQRIPRADRLGLSTFADLRDFRTKGVAVKKVHLAEEIASLNREVFAAFERVSSKGQKEKALGEITKNLASLLKDRPDTATAHTGDLERLKALQAQLQALEASVASAQAQLSVVDEVETKFATLGSRISAFNEEIRDLLGVINLRDHSDVFVVQLPSKYREILEGKRRETAENITAFREGVREGGTIQSTQADIIQVSSQLNLSESKRVAFEKFEKDRIALEEQIASYGSELRAIDTTIAAELAKQRLARLEKYLDYFEVLKEEKTALESLYQPLRDALAASVKGSKKLEFQAKIGFDSQAHANNGSELFDSRKKGRFRDPELLQAELKKLMGDLEAATFDRDCARKRIVEFREEFLVDTEGKRIELGTQLKRAKSEEDFNNWFFSLAPYRVDYSITFEGRDLSLLSPGQKGIVLLMVYLEVDVDDQRPLIIDQPEDNLDNLSVYSNLIEFFRNRKLYRQIILVTHNPNLVVNTDSEQIVIASYQGDRYPKISYRSGAIEDTSTSPPGVREDVCAILEGGTEAFQRREQKYAL